MSQEPPVLLKDLQKPAQTATLPQVNTGIVDYTEPQSAINDNVIELSPAFSEIERLEPERELIKGTISEKGKLEEKSKSNPIWKTIKGRTDKNSLMLGMWSKHFSSHKYRETHNLAALQYKGFIAGTFTNSHGNQVFMAGIARNLLRKRFGEDMAVDLGYKLAPMYGYKDYVPNISGFSILPVICLDTSYKNIGLTLNLFPSAAVSVSTYINLDIFKGKEKKKKENPI